MSQRGKLLKRRQDGEEISSPSALSGAAGRGGKGWVDEMLAARGVPIPVTTVTRVPLPTATKNRPTRTAAGQAARKAETLGTDTLKMGMGENLAARQAVADGPRELPRGDGLPAVTLPVQGKTAHRATGVAPELEKNPVTQDRRAAARLHRTRDLSPTSEAYQQVMERGEQRLDRFGAPERVGAAVQSIATSAAATPVLLGDATAQTLRNDLERARRAKSAEGQRLYEQYQQAAGLMRNLSPTSEAYRQAKEQADAAMRAIRALNPDTPVNTDSKGMQMMREAYGYQEQALQGMEGPGRFLAETGISIGRNAVLLPTAAINPAIPLLGMSAQAAADKTYELTERGIGAGEALGRGVISGAIEAATEKIPLDTLLDAVKTGGRGVIRNLLRQSGVEATEEGISYVLNFAADKLAKDPEATFDPREMLSSAAAGGLSGAFFGAVGTGVNYLNREGTTPALLPRGDGKPAVTAQTGTEEVSQRPVQPGQVEVQSEQQKTASTREAVAEKPLVQRVREAIPSLQGMESVTTVTGEELPKGGKLVDRLMQFVGRFGNKVTRPGFGEVLFSKGRIKNSMVGHGSGPAKIETFAAVPAVIERGVQIDHESNWKGRGYDTYLFAAPVEYRGRTTYLGVVVTKDVQDGRYYVHEVVDGDGTFIYGDKEKAGVTIQDGRASLSGTVDTVTTPADAGTAAQDGRSSLSGELDTVSYPASEVSISQDGRGVKGTEAQPAGVNEDGTPAGGTLPETITWQGYELKRPAGATDNWWRETVELFQHRAEHLTVQEWEMLKRAHADQILQQTTDGKYRYVGTPATEALGIRPVKAITDLGQARSLRGLERGRYEANRKIDRLLKESALDDRARMIAQGVADGTFRLEDARRLGLDPGVIQEVAEAYRVRDSFSREALQAKRARNNWDFDAKVQELLKDSDQGKPPKMVSLSANTMQRNNERTFGKSAAAINAEIFDPVIQNEAERIRFVNRELARMEEFHLTREESAQVQLLMEEQTTEGELRAKGYDADRLAKAAKTLGAMYSQYYEAVNDFLVAHGYKEIGFQKNYAPHMQEEQELGRLQKYLARLGFDTRVTELPTDLAGRTDTFRPGKQYDPYFQHRVGTDTKYDAVEGLESYLNYLSNVFYHTDDIQKLRRLSEALRYKYGTDELRARLDQLNNLQEAQWEEWAAPERNIQEEKERAYEQLGQIRKFGGYVTVLDDYTNILAGKQTFMDRAFENRLGRGALNLGRGIQNAFARAAIMGNLSSAINQTVQLPQLIAEVGPHYVTRAVWDVLSGETAKGDFNQRSDFLTGKMGIQTISEKKGRERVFDLAGKPFEIIDDFASRVIVRSKYLEQLQNGADPETALQAADQFAARLVGSRMKGAKPVIFEDKNAVMKLVTTFQLEVANGWEHIIHDLPLEIKTIAETQGKKAAVKRTAELLVASQLAACVANMLIKAITGREPVPYDGIGMALNYLSNGYGMTKRDYMAALADDVAQVTGIGRPLGTAEDWTPESFSVTRAGGALAEDALEDVPYLSNLTTLVGLTDGRIPLPQVSNTKMTSGAARLAGAFFGEEDPEQKREEMAQGARSLALGLGEAVTTWAPMGSQIKKSAQGTTAWFRGGVYSGTDGTRLQYSVDRNPQNFARGLLFGKSALPESDAYWAEGARLLTAAQTELWKDLQAAGMSGNEAYAAIQGLRQTKKSEENSQTVERLRMLREGDLPDEWAAELYYGMLASDSERKLMDSLGTKAEDRAKLYRALATLREVGGTGEGWTARRREALVEMTELTEREKQLVGLGVLGDSRKLDYSSRAGLQISLMSDSNREKAAQAKAAGIDAETFLAAYEAQQKAQSEVDYFGNTVSLSRDRNQKKAIDAVAQDLSVAQLALLYRLFGVSQKVWGPLGLSRGNGRGK